jgi:hypothetical protein
VLGVRGPLPLQAASHQLRSQADEARFASPTPSAGFHALMGPPSISSSAAHPLRFCVPLPRSYPSYFLCSAASPVSPSSAPINFQPRSPCLIFWSPDTSSLSILCLLLHFPSFLAHQFLQWPGDLATGRAKRSRWRRLRHAKTSISSLAMASTEKSSHQTFADTLGTTH